MAFNLTRMTAYALVSAIEEDLRSIVLEYVDLNFINHDLRNRAIDRLYKDIGVSLNQDEYNLKDLINYFDLGDTFQVINANKSLVPEFITSIIHTNNKDFEKIIPIRNRVMHIRPLNFADLPYLTDFCNSLSAENNNLWVHVYDTINKLNSDPSFVLSLDIKSISDESNKNHNLPLPDFDETGLIGRDLDVNKVKKLCLGGFPVISIVGEGGVGKTALALKVAYDLLEDENSPFESIIWVSSKTSQITVHEIKDIKGAINSSFGVIDELSQHIIGQPMSSSGFEEISEYLSTFKIALFIDNLETILDDRIKEFISEVGALSSGSKIIITSRIGLGAYEYPVKLNGIAEEFGSQLLRTLAKIRNVESLYKLPELTLKTYVNRMKRNPSYIKWFVSCVQTGLPPEKVLQNSNLFLEFCMSNVYRYLSADARFITDSMQCAPGLKDIPELAYLTNFDSLKIQKAIQELMSTNMLYQTSEAKGSSVKTTYELSEIARLYLGKYHKPSKSFQAAIKEKRNKLNSIYEAQLQSNSAEKYLMHSIKLRDKKDRIIAKMLTDALKQIKNGLHDKAFEQLQEAHRLSPDYSEVARVTAHFYDKSGNLADAREQYELALVLEPKSPQLNYWFGKFLLHSEENTSDAIIFFEKAHKLDPNSIFVLLALARAYMFQRQFTETEGILSLLEQKYDEFKYHDQHCRMFLDTKIQVMYRKADENCQIGNYNEAIKYLIEMITLFKDLPLKYKDTYMKQKLQKSEYNLKHLMKVDEPTINERAKEIYNQILEEISA